MLLPYKFYGRDMSGMHFFIFASWLLCSNVRGINNNIIPTRVIWNNMKFNGKDIKTVNELWLITYLLENCFV